MSETPGNRRFKMTDTEVWTAERSVMERGAKARHEASMRPRETASHREKTSTWSSRERPSRLRTLR